MKSFKPVVTQNNTTSPISSARIQLSTRELITIPVPVGATTARISSVGNFYVMPGELPIDFPQLQNNAGYQKIILENWVDYSTPLNFTPTTTYSANIIINGSMIVNFSAPGSSLTTVNDIVVAIAALINPNPYNSGIAVNNDLGQNYLFVYSATQNKLDASVEIIDNNLFKNIPGFKRMNKAVSLSNPFLLDVIPEFNPSILDVNDVEYVTIQTTDWDPMGGGLTEILINFYQ